MSCEHCGTPLAGAAHFCGACGRPITPAPPPQTPSPQASQSRPPAVAFDETVAADTDVKALGYEGEAPDPVPANRRADSNAETLYGTRSPLLEPVAAPRPSYPGTIPPNDPYVGTTLRGRFEIKTKLGEGGFGAVYFGVQTGTGRQVAIKMLHPEMTRDNNVVARFRREGQVLCNLRDAHTITTYDFDQTDDGTLFIAMELLEGRSLHDVFHDEAPIEYARMVKIISECCSSLAEAHAQGIIHRDLKPENIHLEKRSGNPEFVKILDFGIAKVVHGDGFGNPDQPQLTASGQTLGTLEYMSPEQLMGKELDGRSDVYGLGVVAYELLTGRLPFPEATGPAALIAAQLRKTPPHPSSINQLLPRDIDALILKMLEKDRANRHRDVMDLRQACNTLLDADKSGNIGVVNPGRASLGGSSPGRTNLGGSNPGRANLGGSSAPPMRHGSGPQATGQPAAPHVQSSAAPRSGPGIAAAQGYQHSSGAFRHAPPGRPMGPDTRGELAATNRGRGQIALVLIGIAALVAIGVVLALT